jgi:hypothetical protein
MVLNIVLNKMELSSHMVFFALCFVLMFFLLLMHSMLTFPFDLFLCLCWSFKGILDVLYACIEVLMMLLIILIYCLLYFIVLYFCFVKVCFVNMCLCLVIWWGDWNWCYSSNLSISFCHYRINSKPLLWRW